MSVALNLESLPLVVPALWGTFIEPNPQGVIDGREMPGIDVQDGWVIVVMGKREAQPLGLHPLVASGHR